jgi:hypothetical protein
MFVARQPKYGKGGETTTQRSSYPPCPFHPPYLPRCPSSQILCVQQRSARPEILENQLQKRTIWPESKDYLQICCPYPTEARLPFILALKPDLFTLSWLLREYMFISMHKCQNSWTNYLTTFYEQMTLTWRFKRRPEALSKCARAVPS